MTNWTIWYLGTIYALLAICGAGFRYYRWWDASHPDSSWKAHILQWWWSFMGITCIYALRFIKFDTVFRAAGEYIGVIGACVIGYTMMHIYISERK